MPDVVGQHVGDGRADAPATRASRCSIETRAVPTRCPRDRVIAQDPQPGDAGEGGLDGHAAPSPAGRATRRCRTSWGSPQSRRRAGARGGRLQGRRRARSSPTRSTKGRVIATSPAEGTLLERGHARSRWSCRSGPAAGRGARRGRARPRRRAPSALDAAGLQADVHRAGDADKDPGTVLEQDAGGRHAGAPRARRSS